MKLENMSEFNFKSSVCTSREQSERLLALGLKKETADMCHFWHWESDDYSRVCASWEFAHRSNKDIPAWSLHRLIEMADTTTHIEEEQWVCMDKCYCWNNYESFYATNLYDSLINCIEWLIKKGYFNKEYLV